MDRIILQDANGLNRQVDLDRSPDTCPLCQFSIEPIDCGYVAAEERVDDDLPPELDCDDWIVVLFRCPRRSCGRHFLAFYHHNERFSRTEDHSLQSCEPRSNPEASFPKVIEKLSPNFVEIYNQALAAESYHLDQVCGPGYRKALEFLIKDFLIDAKVADESTIKDTFLGNCIKNHVSDPKVKKTAQRAAWLGNDETHYERRWIDKEITDLKGLIQLTVNWIESEILTKQLETDMPE